MRKRIIMKFVVSMFFFALVDTPLSAQEPLPKSDDFAGELSLGGTGDSLLKIEIPEVVYRSLERPDRGDMRVFDAGGNMVPFTVRPVPGSLEVPPPQEIPFFLWREEGRRLPGGTDIEIDTEGTVLRIKNQRATVSAQPIYLLDLSGLGYSPAELNLEMKEEHFFNAAVILFSSKDLNNWKEFDKRQIIAWYGESGASRTIVELPGDNPRYLLLRFDRGELKPARIFAVFSETELPPPLRETTIPGKISDDRRAIEYNTGGFFPLVSIGFRPGETDSLDVQIKNKLYAADEWNPVARATLYRLGSGSGEFIYNKAMQTKSAAPFWRIEAQGESVFSSDVECTIHWTAQELVFLGRGAGPWIVAFGNPDWAASGGLKLEEYPPGAQAEITEARLLGEGRYRQKHEAPRPDRDWGQWLLWGILILAVLILLTLAFITAKSMAKEK
ncbi:hypothetical protein AGMMS50293_16210 [Spirochaetia bacterium]|nr:hypothetical protein AGMMS50293_16210 [Spirochaetia bacterium]